MSASKNIVSDQCFAELRAVAHDPEALAEALRELMLTLGARKRLELALRAPVLLSTTDGAQVPISLDAAKGSSYLRSALQFAACAQNPSSTVAIPFEASELEPVVALCERTPHSPLSTFETKELVHLIRVSDFLGVGEPLTMAITAFSHRCCCLPLARLQEDLGCPPQPTPTALNEQLFELPGVRDTSARAEGASLIERICGDVLLGFILAECDACALLALKLCSSSLKHAVRAVLCSDRWCCNTDSAAVGDGGETHQCCGWYTRMPSTFGSSMITGAPLPSPEELSKQHYVSGSRHDWPIAQRLAAALYVVANPSASLRRIWLDHGLWTAQSEVRVAHTLGTVLARGGAPLLEEITFTGMHDIKAAVLPVGWIRSDCDLDHPPQLDLERRGLGEFGLIVLMHLLGAGGRSKRLCSLKLGGNAARETSVRMLARLLHHNGTCSLPELRVLHFGEDVDGDESDAAVPIPLRNQLSAVSAAALTTAVCTSALDEVMIQSYRLSLSSLDKFSQVTRLDMACRGVCDHDVTIMARMFREGGAPMLASLALDSNSLECSSALALGDALDKGALPRLRKLSLFGNRIQTEAALTLLRAFSHAPASEGATGTPAANRSPGGVMPVIPRPQKHLNLLGCPVDIAQLNEKSPAATDVTVVV